MVYLGLAKSYNSGCTFCGEPSVSPENRRGTVFYREGKLGGAVVNKRSIGGNWEVEV